MRPYEPLLRNAHLITIASNFWNRPLDTARFPVKALRYSTEPGVEVLTHEQQPAGSPLGHLILVHGLEGSSNGGYMRSLANTALEAGFAVYRTNIRGCGGTEGWCNTLYHAGLTTDIAFLARAIRAKSSEPIFCAGFSLGGNQVLKFAGELCESGPDLLAGVCAVSAPLDLAACAKRIERRDNILYQWRFIASMRKRLRRRNELMPGRFPVEGLDALRTIYDFDDRVTAQHFGFGSADNYYATQSSGQFLDRIRIPALLIASKDDPLVPFEVYESPAIAANPLLQLIATGHGGHVSFLASSRPRFWLDAVIANWMLKQVPDNGTNLRRNASLKASQ